MFLYCVITLVHSWQHIVLSNTAYMLNKIRSDASRGQRRRRSVQQVPRDEESEEHRQRACVASHVLPLRRSRRTRAKQHDFWAWIRSGWYHRSIWTSGRSSWCWCQGRNLWVVVAAAARASVRWRWMRRCGRSTTYAARRGAFPTPTPCDAGKELWMAKGCAGASGEPLAQQTARKSASDHWVWACTASCLFSLVSHRHVRRKRSRPSHMDIACDDGVVQLKCIGTALL
jgi:hypothetical protein